VSKDKITDLDFDIQEVEQIIAPGLLFTGGGTSNQGAQDPSETLDDSISSQGGVSGREEPVDEPPGDDYEEGRPTRRRCDTCDNACGGF
jgi:hypothetical protein